MRIFNTNVKSILLYGSETRRMTQADLYEKLSTPKALYPEKVRKEDTWKKTIQETVAALISRRKWGWIDHTHRKPASNITRQALAWNPQGNRKRGRPRNSWRRDTEAEILRSGHSWKEIEKTA